MKNRKSARKSRKRRKAEITTLKEEIQALKEENHRLKRLVKESDKNKEGKGAGHNPKKTLEEEKQLTKKGTKEV